MPRYYPSKNRYQARVKVGGKEYHLGYWKDYERAIEVEEIFKADNNLETRPNPTQVVRDVMRHRGCWRKRLKIPCRFC